jgi:hypothetical protein
VTVKQLFETYVYDQILSSADLLPFVITLRKFQTRSRAATVDNATGHAEKIS